MDVDSDYSDDELSEQYSPSPAPVKGKKAAVTKKAVLAPSNVANIAPPVAASAAGGSKAGKALEEIYQKKSQLEHILLRPDTYIGSVEKQQASLWVHDGQRMEQRAVSFVPGLYKIFDEILVNAADNKVRDPSMDAIKVVIDVAAGSIQVWNNGNGIPVEVHKEEKVYVPELIFGHLLTSSNYDDNEKKITGGRNGYGAKLANIFSTEFVLETCDGSRQRRYKQVFSSNMTQKKDPVISSCKASDNWTCITFKPDLAKFGMTELEDDTVALMRKRVYDLAGILGKGCKVFLNGTRLSIKGFAEYCDLYLGPKEGGGPARVYERVNDRWEVCVSPTDGQPQQISFVNSICTIKGGTHVNHIVDQITKALVERINKKHKHANVKPFMVKNHLWVFVNAQIENPTFDSQTKENLTLRASSFGSKCELSPQFLERIAKSGVVDGILQFATFKNAKELKKGDGAKLHRVVGIPKLDDANDAGGRNSAHCTLILTEGDSAKTLAISGLSVVGRDHYGVFPLRGKLLNVRDASASQITGNVEIQALKQILGLQHGKVYDDVRSLRYGHVMIMTDQDHDGSHIKGLIMNFLHAFYPSLLRLPGFLLEFITPIIKAVKGNQKLVFYTMPEYEAWKDRVGSTTGWSIKYYKGLGTSTRDEAREYFAAIDHHRKKFVWKGDQDGAAIEMAFSKKKVDERKEWLSGFVPGTFLDNSASTISYHDFIHKELILFSRADLERSIPSMVDGLKPGQRKILFACFKRNLRKDIKVAQLAGYVSEHAAYHHGEASLASTIVGLAQDFVGSNNINLLVPSGQFGTRLQGGKDAASARYIFTRMAPLTRHLFNEADDQLLTYLNEEGQSIEPEWYVPILPMVLVNGAEGIGTGWSTSIPNYNPRDIVANLKRLLAGEQQEPMSPWYRGFHGSITEATARSTSGKSYSCTGTLSVVDDCMAEVLELPVRRWTQDYKEFLEGLVRPPEKEEAPALAEYKEHHTDVTVRFVLQFLPGKMEELRAAGGAGGLEAKLKLATKFSTSNMMLFDAHGRIKHYSSPEEIVAEFFTLRLGLYEKRRQALLRVAETELLRLSNRARFILAVISGELVVSNRRKAAVEADLAAGGYDRMASGGPGAKGGRGGGGRGGGGNSDEEETEEEQEAASRAAGTPVGPRLSYDYLLSMPIYSLTREKVEALQAEAGQQASRVAHLAATSAAVMWEDDLEAFITAYEAWDAEQDAAAAKLVAQQRGVKGGGSRAKAAAAPAAAKKAAAGAGMTKAKKKAAAWSESEDEEDMEDSDISDGGSDDDTEMRDVAKRPAAKAPAQKRAAPAKAPAAAKPPPAPKAVATSAGSAKPPSAAGPKPAAPAPSASLRPSVSGTSSAAGGAATSSQQQPALSLGARLAGRFQKLTVAGTADTAQAPAPLPLSPLPAHLEATAESPAPALAKARVAAATKAVAKPDAAPAAAAKRKPAAPKAAVAAVAAAPTTKAPPPRKKRVIMSDSDEEDDEEEPTTEESEGGSEVQGLGKDRREDAFPLEAPSPAIAPKGKKSKVGPSPLAMKKLAAKTAPPKATKAASAPTGKASTDVTALATTVATAAEEARPQRARRAVQNVSYIQIDDSDEEGGAAEDASSDYQASEEDD